MKLKAKQKVEEQLAKNRQAQGEREKEQEEMKAAIADLKEQVEGVRTGKKLQEAMDTLKKTIEEEKVALRKQLTEMEAVLGIHRGVLQEKGQLLRQLGWQDELRALLECVPPFDLLTASERSGGSGSRRAVLAAAAPRVACGVRQSGGGASRGTRAGAQTTGRARGIRIGIVAIGRGQGHKQGGTADVHQLLSNL